MPSNAYIENLCKITASDTPLELIEFNHSILAQPLRFVKDNQTIKSNGNTYYPSSFAIKYPDAGENQQSKANLVLDNLNPEIGKMIDRLRGARGATLKIMHVMRATPNTVDYSILFNDIGAITISKKNISFELNFINTINTKSVDFFYTPENAQGIF